MKNTKNTKSASASASVSSAKKVSYKGKQPSTQSQPTVPQFDARKVALESFDGLKSLIQNSLSWKLKMSPATIATNFPLTAIHTTDLKAENGFTLVYSFALGLFPSHGFSHKVYGAELGRIGNEAIFVAGNLLTDEKGTVAVSIEGYKALRATTCGRDLPACKMLFASAGLLVGRTLNFLVRLELDNRSLYWLIQDKHCASAHRKLPDSWLPLIDAINSTG